MKYRDRFSRLGIVGLILVCLLPAATFLFGIVCLILGMLPNLTFLVFFLLIPLGSVALMYLLVASGLQRSTKVEIGIVFTMLYVFVLFGSLFVGRFQVLRRYRNDHVSRPYQKVVEEYAYMPQLSELGEPQKLEYYDYVSAGIFMWESDTLVCKYDQAEYDTQKALLSDRYVFQNQTMTYIYDSWGCEPFGEVDGYFFRALSLEGEYGKELYYPKRLILVGTNDETCEIVYIAFYDFDLDYIESLPEFIEDDCGWKYIR